MWQEPSSDDYDSLSKSLRQQNMDQLSTPMQNSTSNNPESNAPSSSNLTSLIKV